MASQNKPEPQTDKHFDDRRLRRPHFLDKRHYQAGQNLCIQPLRAKIHTSVQFETSSPNLQCRKNSNILPRNKGGSATDSIRQSDLPKRLSVGAIAFVAGARSKATGDPHTPRNVRARGRDMASRRRRENEVFSCRWVQPRNEDGIPMPRLPKMFSSPTGGNNKR